jgi:hypothetical protein
MWPLVVDTVFTASENRTAAPVMSSGNPGEVSLMPVDWNVTWTIKRGTSGESNGLKDLLRARRDTDSSDEPLGVPTIKVRVPGTADPKSDSGIPTLSLNGNVVGGSIGTYTNGFAKIGTTGAVNFEMKYVPFNLTAKGPWNNVELGSAFTEGDMPVWIIRNGVNDLAQDERTDFSDDWNGTANGNGAVRFSIAPKTSTGDDKLVVKDGKFLGPSDPTKPNKPDITFTTDGYDDEEEAEVYYAVVLKAGGEEDQQTPGYSDYIPLNPPVRPGEDHKKQISLDPTQVGKDCDIYVIIYKDGEVSEPEIINTEEGGVVTEPIWGEEPYMRFYVASPASNGNDNNPGTRGKPLATVGEALNRLATAYAPDTASWQGKGTDDVHPGAIIILDTVNVAQMITIDNKFDAYPPIVLCDDPETPGGTLKATTTIEDTKSLLRLDNGARVTLTGNLILKGLKRLPRDTPATKIRGVLVTGSTFTMNGGTISGYHITGYGGGVYVDSGTFTMYGGTISENYSTDGGGGIYVDGGSTFIMNNGTISENFDSALHFGKGGGGVYVDNGSTFTMENGEISKNSSMNNGGGVYVDGGSTFTMNNGTISENSSDDAGGFGGGVYVTTNGTLFTMNGGTISDCHSGCGGGVAVTTNGMFTMNGGTIFDCYSDFGTGGGVAVGINGTFTMNGGEISKNKSYGGGGGGVAVSSSTFTMKNGEIWGNTIAGVVAGGGGGVYLVYARFSKTGGIIYGFDEDDPNNRKNNKIIDSHSGTDIILSELGAVGGHAVYLDAYRQQHYKENTVGKDDILYWDYPGEPDFGW